MLISGPASHVQNTIQVTGGGQAPARTRHICLFRLHGQQVVFKGWKPFSIVDGDLVVVSGKETSSGFNADAVRNAATGLTADRGIVGKIITGLSLLIFPLFFCLLLAAIGGGAFFYFYAAFFLMAIYCFYRAFCVGLSLGAVRDFRL